MRTKKISLKEAIISTIKETGWLTYSQLMRALQVKGFEVEGNTELHNGNLNIVLWGGLSKNVADTLSELINERAIETIPAPVELFQIDNFTFEMPVYLPIPKQKLEKPTLHLTFLRYVMPQDAPDETPQSTTSEK